MVCGYFILPEPASYVFFYAIFNLRNLFYLIAFFWTITKILVSAQEPKIKSAQSKFSAAQSKCQWQAKDVMIMRF